MCWAPVMYKSLYKELAKDRQYKDRISALSGFLILWKMQTCHSSQIKYKYTMFSAKAIQYNKDVNYSQVELWIQCNSNKTQLSISWKWVS